MNGFFGKLKDKVFGVAKAEGKKEAKKLEKKVSPARGRHIANHKQKGAFGGTGTGRGLKGRPGVKLLRKTVEAGWLARKRVQFSKEAVTK